MPLQPGWTVRPPTMEDLPTAVELFNMCANELIGHSQFGIDDIRGEWQTPGFSLANDIRLVFAPDGALAGYIEVWDVMEPSVRVHCWGRVHPALRGNGVGSWLIEWGVERARQAVARAPEGARVVVGAELMRQDGPGHALLRDHGFEVIRTSRHMHIDLTGAPPAPVWPASISVRPMNYPAELPALVQAVRAAFKDHWGHVPTPFEEDLKRWQHWTTADPKFDPRHWWLAMDGDQIAGMAICTAETSEDQDMAWVNTLGVLRPWRRQGLALALLHYVFGEFYAQGKRKVGLSVDGQSLTGATHLYEKAGMHTAREYQTFEQELRAGTDLTTQAVGA